MPFTSSGSYSPPATNLYPAVDGAIINASDLQTLFGDIVAALGQCQLRNQVSVASAPILMNFNKISGLPNATAPTDAVPLSQVQSMIAASSIGTGTYLALNPTPPYDTMAGLFKLYGTNASDQWHPVPLGQLTSILSGYLSTNALSNITSILTFVGAGAKIRLDHNAAESMEPVTFQQMTAALSSTVVIKELVFGAFSGYNGGYLSMGTGSGSAVRFCMQWGEADFTYTQYVQTITWPVAFDVGCVPTVLAWAMLRGAGAYINYVASCYTGLPTNTGVEIRVQAEDATSKVFQNPSSFGQYGWFRLNWVAIGKRTL